MFKPKKFIPPLILGLIPFITGLFFCGSMPEEMAVQFNFRLEPKNYVSREFALFGIPLIMIVLYILAVAAVEQDTDNTKFNQRLKTICYWIIPVISLISNIIFILYNK